MNERSPQLGVKYKDLAILKSLVDGGADLDQSRHVVYYCYAPSEAAARAMGQEAEAGHFTAEIREPQPEFPGQWAVVCNKYAVTSPDFAREQDDFFEALAARHGADYDGWEASI